MEVAGVAVEGFDALAHLLLDELEVGHFVGADEGDGLAGGIGAAGAADAVEVVFGRAGEFVVDDAGQGLDVDAAGE